MDTPVLDKTQINQGPPDGDKQAPPRDGYSLLAPGLWPLDGQELIKVTGFTAVAGVTIRVTARTIKQDGRIQRHIFTVAPTNNRTGVTLAAAIGDGFFLDVTARVSAGTPLYGQAAVVVDLVVGLSGEQQAVTTLLAGYVTANSPIFGPTQTPTIFVDGPGDVRSVQVGNPAAGADFTTTVPTGARWELVGVSAKLSTGIGVANRIANIVITDGVNQLFESTANVAQAASLADIYTYAEGAQVFNALSEGLLLAPLPSGNRLLAGWVISSATVNIQAADQWSQISLMVREWLEL